MIVKPSLLLPNIVAQARPVLEFLQSLEGADQERPVPLSAEEASALAGTYVFGTGVSEQIDVDANLKIYASSKMYSYLPQLNWTRKGTMPRPLFHLEVSARFVPPALQRCASVLYKRMAS